MEPLTEAQQQLYDWLVAYIRNHNCSPSIRQMMTAMNLKSPAPIQSRLEHLRDKGYISWTEGQARTLHISNSLPKGVPLRGVIAATSLVETFPNPEVEYFDPSEMLLNPNHFALRVCGHSMVDAGILDGDVVILKPVTDPTRIRNGTIVAAHHQGKSTLKHFERKGNKVILRPSNSNHELYPITEVPASEIEIQGQVVSVLRTYE